MPRIPLNVAASLPRRLGPPPKPLPKDFQYTKADARSMFRSLWRVGSLSVMYTNPSREIIREKIREAFEVSQTTPLKDPNEIKEQWERALNTKFFFEIASTRFGIEHSVISNMCKVIAEKKQGTSRVVKLTIRQVQQEITQDYNNVVKGLNDSMRLSLPLL